MDVPERPGVELTNGLPPSFIGWGLRPNAHAAEQLLELGCEPRAEVDAVRHMPDLWLLAGPERRPHRARDLAVQLGNAVGGRREPQCERRQSEAVGVFGAAEREQVFVR